MKESVRSTTDNEDMWFPGKIWGKLYSKEKVMVNLFYVAVV